MCRSCRAARRDADAAVTLDNEGKAELDRMIEQQRRVVELLRYGGTPPHSAGAATAAGDVLQRLLVWQQTCDVSP